MKKTPLLIASALFLLPAAAMAQTDGQTPSPGGWGNSGPGPRMTPDERFARMDTNKDGFITRDEFKGRRPEAFDMMDANKDGKLTKDEMVAFMKERMGPGGPRGGGASSSSSSGGN
ncbi:EF-hand domain-containing protein [Asticcacaulis excentricus]|uniref:EF-Hand, Calmodulin n=1 Tax=Asticcacaulis excentricus (strain ATCC 15261 / DSM 4724 / KCTC 12464 / NCIMB 9791 / VKM B-1370 / CB 48) TaxID=573065 RepID=E8RRU2_ASTEC|nr:EF-hand domain-containing protein [Asticcacaulis excentricus]ADU13467.1 EF-Hand, Calmodulin [Asticcacaulis excentricus CB 48]